MKQTDAEKLLDEFKEHLVQYVNTLKTDEVEFGVDLRNTFKRWTKGDKDRLYISADVTLKMLYTENITHEEKEYVHISFGFINLKTNRYSSDKYSGDLKDFDKTIENEVVYAIKKLKKRRAEKAFSKADREVMQDYKTKVERAMRKWFSFNKTTTVLKDELEDLYSDVDMMEHKGMLSETANELHKIVGVGENIILAYDDAYDATHYTLEACEAAKQLEDMPTEAQITDMVRKVVAFTKIGGYYKSEDYTARESRQLKEVTNWLNNTLEEYVNKKAYLEFSAREQEL